MASFAASARIDIASNSGARRGTRYAGAKSSRFLAWGFVAWHLIQFTQEALGGRQNASFYTAKHTRQKA
jgi:hypothetical protein